VYVKIEKAAFIDQLWSRRVLATVIFYSLSIVIETFEETHNDKEYHYTLYYYDRAGNLIQTVPPKGVVRFEASDMDVYTNTEINDLRLNSPEETAILDGSDYMAPDHQLATRYHYNSLNQLVYQETPDGGESRFAYDNLGRLVMSQNAKQAGETTPQFSYTRYDALGRVAEVGEMELSGYEISEKGRLIVTIGGAEAPEVNSSSFPDNLSYVREEITYTIYDDLSPQQVELNSTLEDVVAQFSDYASDNTRNRINGVIYQESYDVDKHEVYNSGIFYDYDVHGNVKELLQVNNYTALLADEQNLKRVNYEYDLVSGNVKRVVYQNGREDQFMHRYVYDADNRIRVAETSEDGFVWEKDAKYFYYDHGPLARTETGEKKVQSSDYAYTIQGWIKTVNGEKQDPALMMGYDGRSGTTNVQNGLDVYGYSLGYFAGDYDAANTVMLSYSGSYGIGGADLYNGNIRSMYTAISDDDEAPLSPLQTYYAYDQLNRIKSMNSNQYSTGTPNPGKYASAYSFDANGNLQTLERYIDDGTATPFLMDNFTYSYNANSNQLNKVVDTEDTGTLGYGDIQDTQGNDNYQYDAIGQLIEDVDEAISLIEWTVTNKVKRITYVGGKIIEFDYDPMGNRIAKHVTESGETVSTFYTLDAQGNQLCMYEFDTDNEILYLAERNIYGSSRVGQEQMNREMTNSAYNFYEDWSTLMGDKRYEMSNHLGNVLQVVTDRKLTVESAGAVDYFTADVVSYSDYFPFGMVMVNRSGGDYRYGFNGMEIDDEVKGSKNSYDFGARILDPRIARWASRDKLESKKPSLSPYQAFMNNPTVFTDPDGNDEFLSIVIKQKGKPDFIIRNHEAISDKVRADACANIPGTALYGQSYYDYRTIITIRLDENGKYESLNKHEYTLTDNRRFTKTSDIIGMTFTMYDEGETFSPSSNWDLEGNGGKQKSGISLYTRKGGSSPTKQKAHFPTEMLEASDIVDLIGGFKGNNNSAKWEKYKDIFEGVSKGDKAIDKIGGDNMSSDLIPGNDKTQANVTTWTVGSDGKYHGSGRDATIKERVEGDTLGSTPLMRNQYVGMSGDTIQGMPPTINK
jgi:RHS repeat-associated protein